ncbi:RNase adapter RapZ [Christensenellaceae bacterium NSJ-44]|uniref:RNase adapter RapZ n=1 Tax=Luoshenia tenuis TaxID=2763654 RepID=A0A926CYW4_9FIRM|nr:RNase adapter RapZ [Luoshenia tenuis]MBC8528161.1 RNase adapter RapZ [Luoshenia tenuis]
MHLVIVTGLSGAGKTQALRYLEDMDYFCVDNLPTQLLPKFAEVGQAAGLDRVAVVMDVRSGNLMGDLYEVLYSLKDYGCTYEIVFFEADEDVLIKRYKETRRAHPLQKQGELVNQAIEQERRMLSPLRDNANRIVDTSDYTLKELRSSLERIFGQKAGAGQLAVTVMSFGFKYGVPQEADLIFDVRFLSNPFYIDALRAHTGREKAVREYVMDLPMTKPFLDKYIEILRMVMPGYVNEGKNQLVIAIGCTGGQHRSVVIAEAIYAALKEDGALVSITHRDMGNDMKR